jgi:hypothetical protein
MKMNDDGSVDIYLAPQAPTGLERNWIPTSGRDFFLFFRFYGPQKGRCLTEVTNCPMSSGFPPNF